MNTAAEVISGIFLYAALTSLFLALSFRAYARFFPAPHRLTVPPFKTGVILRKGLAERVVPAGSYWLMPSRTIITCDTRPTPFQLGPQEFLTHDSMGIRLILTGEYRIQDPAAFITVSSNPATAFLLDLRQSIRTAIAEQSGHTFLATQQTLPTRIRELILPRATHLGIELTVLQITEAIPLGWLKRAMATNPTIIPDLPYGPN